MRGAFFNYSKIFCGGYCALFVAALLVGCGQKREAYSTLNGNSGTGVCNGTIGIVNVKVQVRLGDPSRYDVILSPTWVGLANQLATVTVVQKSTYQYKELARQITLSSYSNITAGVLTIEELDRFDTLAITSYQAGTSFFQANPEKSAICTLPYPGDSLTN